VVQLKQMRLFLHSSPRETGVQERRQWRHRTGRPGLLEAEPEELLPDRPAGVRGVEFSGRTRTSWNRVGVRANILAWRFVRLFVEYNFNVW